MRINRFVLDFDLSIADTFTPSPSGIGVNEATQMAIKSVFGNAGLKVFKKIGGLNNRAPIELISLMIDAEPLLTRRSVKAVTNLFVAEKLKVLTKEITNKWPLPCGNVLNYFKRLKEWEVPYAILSSGHGPFIRRVFEVWDEKDLCPQMLITDDELRNSSLPLNRRSKPHKEVFEYLWEAWSHQDPKILTADKSRVAYIGDDPGKDGWLAKNAGVNFIWYNPRQESLPAGAPIPDVVIKTFNELSP